MAIVNKAAYEIPGFKLGVLEANVDMSSEATWQYAAVDVGAASGSGLTGPAALVAATAGAPILGILQTNPALGEAGEVVVSGVSKAQAGGTFSVGAELMVNGSGQFVLATTGNVAVARALQAGAAGIIISVLLLPAGAKQ